MTEFPAIVVDTREQRPYEFDDHSTIHTALHHGDYSLDGYEDVLSVERKGIEDLARCCGVDRDRFRDQVETGSDNLEEFGLVVDSPRQKVQRGDYYSNIHPNSILGTADAWADRYDVPWYFEPSRNHGKNRTIRLLKKWYVKHQ